MPTNREAPEHTHVGRDDATAFVKRLVSLPEPAMRSALLMEHLASTGPQRAVWTLEWLMRGVLAKEPDCLTVYESLLDPDRSVEALGPELTAELCEVGLQQGCVSALQWLSALTADKAPPCTDDEGERLVHWQLRELTLGDRRARARRASGDAANRFICDPDPGVIGNLLNNPRTTEQRVLAICSRRPTLSAPLETVVRSTRWIRRYHVKLALVRNPHLAPRYGIILLPCLTRIDLQQVRDDATLCPALRRAAQRLANLDIDSDAP